MGWDSGLLFNVDLADALVTLFTQQGDIVGRTTLHHLLADTQMIPNIIITNSRPCCGFDQITFLR
jgi:hypothetical protein